MPLSPSGSLAQSYAEDRGGRGPSPPAPGPRRVVLKRNALEVEEDEGTGATPKLAVPKRRLHAAARGGGGGAAAALPATAARDASPAVDLHTDLHDVHAYVLANWVFQLLHARPRMQSLRAEVLPLLVARQYRGLEAAFGPTGWRTPRGPARLRGVLRAMDAGGLRVVEGAGASAAAAPARDEIMARLCAAAAGGDWPGTAPPPGDPTAAPKEARLSTLPSGSPPPAEEEEAFPASRHPFAVVAQVLSTD